MVIGIVNYYYLKCYHKVPINKENLSKDFNINNESDLEKIMKGLEDGSKIYLNKLKTLDRNYYSDSKPNSSYSCESCAIF